MGIYSVLQDIYNSMFVKEVNKKPNLGEDVRLVVHSSEFENHLRYSTPIFATSLIAWPTYWFYRGLVWHRVVNVEPSLPVYIRKTFYRVKVIEFAILFTGILMAIKSGRKSLDRQLDIQEMVQRK